MIKNETNRTSTIAVVFRKQ